MNTHECELVPSALRRRHRRGRLRVAYSARDRYEFNKHTIDRLEFAFQAAVVTLGLQTLLWVLALAVR